MEIKQQIESILNHPFFKVAIHKYQEGDTSDIKHLFFECIFHAYEKSTLNASRTYGTNRWLDTCEILAEIRNTAPPTNLDLRLPIPNRKELETASIQPKKKSNHLRKVHPINPQQLTIVFQQIA